MRSETHKRNLLQALNGLILGDDAISLEDLRSRAFGMRPFLTPDLADEDVEDVIDRVTELRAVELKLGFGVVNPATYSEWLEERKKTLTLTRWNAYEQLLLRREWSPGVIEKLDAQTDKLVELMGDPHLPGEWARRGLAIGEVQSGKTATYIGVLNKAIDLGYKLVVIIGGHTEDLRRQTQRRVDTDLTGRDSSFMSENIDTDAARTWVGVGLIDQSPETNVLTTTRSDFSSSNKRAGLVALAGETPTVFVVKKNAKVLSNLTAYLKRQALHGRHTVPLVVIDDEADWASINTKSEEDVAAVNNAIRDLLSASARNSYLGITATPFANILIDDEVAEDLFPADYIQALESPSNYQGIESYFGPAKPGNPHLITDVDDCLSVLPFGHKRSHTVSALPETMLDAIAAFYVGSAIRRVREIDRRPASMLINVSRFNDVQGQVARLVAEEVENLNERVSAEFGLPEGRRESDETRRLRDIYEREYPSVDVSWSTVRQELLDIAAEIRIELVNGLTMPLRNKRMYEMSREAREQEALQPTIFIGGDVLARGLTLDGLQVSYFVRRAGAADTLLQMGRWFGYRPKYDDLVRLWIDQDVVDLFEYVAEVSTELRSSLREMNALKLTPKHFGLKIRKHPESFLITAANKQKHGALYEAIVSIHGEAFESYLLSANRADRDRNRVAVEELVKQLAEVPDEPADQRDGGNVIWREVPAQFVEALLTKFRGHDDEPYFGRPRGGTHAQISAYLDEAKNSESWDVAFVSGNGERVRIAEALNITSSLRNRMKFDGDGIRMGNRRVASGNDIRNVLPKAKVRELQAMSGATLGQKTVLHKGLERPTVLVYAITTEVENPNVSVKITAEDPLFALVIAFPALTPEEEAEELREGSGQKFIVNKVFARINFGMPVTDEEYEADDEY